MNANTFDKLGYLDALKSAGVPEDQARAHANALDAALRETVATKADLNVAQAALGAEIVGNRSELKQDIAELRAEVKQDIAELRAEVKQDIAELRAELKEEMAELRTEMRVENANIRAEMADMKAELQRWMIGIAVGQTALIVALLRFL